MVAVGMLILTVGVLLLWSAITGENPIATLRAALAGDLGELQT